MSKIKRAISKLRRSVLIRSQALNEGPTVAPTDSEPRSNVCQPQSPQGWRRSTDVRLTRERDLRQKNALLEDLPPEIRRHLLFSMDFMGLALVHASPVYHEQYLLDRRALLCRYLEPELHMVGRDAFAVDQSGTHEFSLLRSRKEHVLDFLKFYQNGSSPNSILHTNDSVSIAVLGRMASFHFAVIQPLVRSYHDWTLAKLSKEIDVPIKHDPLSKTERIRLMRALYRFQLCCNLFGIGRYGIPRGTKLEMDEMDILKHFICIFEPWEVEEICCIYTFAKMKYEQIFDDISWDVNEKNPKFDGQRPPTPDGAFHLHNGSIRYYLLKGTISCGLELLSHVLFDMKDHEHLVSTMQKRMTCFQGDFLEDDALGDLTQAKRRREAPTERDRKPRRRDPLPFQGDVETDPEGVYPPLAWTVLWGGTYSNLYGYYVGDDIRCWGYVIWDGSRFERMGAEAVLRRQRAGEFDGGDPRDHNFLML